MQIGLKNMLDYNLKVRGYYTYKELELINKEKMNNMSMKKELSEKIEKVLRKLMDEDHYKINAFQLQEWIIEAKKLEAEGSDYQQQIINTQAKEIIELNETVKSYIESLEDAENKISTLEEQPPKVSEISADETTHSKFYKLLNKSFEVWNESLGNKCYGKMGNEEHFYFIRYEGTGKPNSTHSYDEVAKMFNDYFASQFRNQSKEEAVGFVDWLESTEFIKSSEDGLWYDVTNLRYSKRFTTQEMYDLYKSKP